MRLAAATNDCTRRDMCRTMLSGWELVVTICQAKKLSPVTLTIVKLIEPDRMSTLPTADDVDLPSRRPIFDHRFHAHSGGCYRHSLVWGRKRVRDREIP